MKKCFTLIVLFLACRLSAQTAQQVLTESGNAFRDNKYLSMEVSVFTYSGSTASGVLIGKGQMRKSPEGYYSKFMDDEMISNRHCTVILNHASKTMVCFTGEKQKRKNTQAMVPADSLGRPGDSLVYRGVENGEKHVTIYHKGWFYVRTEMYIAEATSLPSRIIYYHAQANDEFTTDAYKTEVVYEKISFEEPESKWFSEEPYVEKKDGKWIATAAYKKYKLTVSETSEL